tara:strand:+ start:2378 stop:4060 length:1683 start_codon:yes stop_codon:yes gene_type:complete
MKLDLFILFFFYTTSLLSILGYGLVFQKLIKTSRSPICIGYTGLFGIFFLIIISYITNIFLPHDLLHNSIIFIIGLSVFFYFFLNNFFLVQDLKLFPIIFLFLFVSFIIFKAHDDFPYYHFPYTYYLTENSSYVGIGNFNHGFRTPSSIFYLNSLFYLPIIKYNLFHIGSLAIFGFSIYLFIKKVLNSLKNKNINYLYYYNLLSLIFIIVFFYRLGEHGTDRSAMILVLIIISEILRIFSKEKISDYDISILTILFILTISLKAFYFLYTLILLPFLIFIYYKIGSFKLINLLHKNKSTYISIVLLILILLNNFLNTGCLVYPILKSCFTNFEWSIQTTEINRMILHYENWSKAGMTPNSIVPNPENYVKNLNWVSNWFNTYFLFKVSDFILGILFMLFISYLIFNSKLKKKQNLPNEIYFLYFVILILISEWFYNHPTLRYGGYSLIAVSLILPFSIYLSRNKLKFISIKNKTFLILSIALCIFVFRNVDRLYDENKKYEFNILKSPYYELKNVHFRLDKKFDNMINDYEKCLENKKNCKIKSTTVKKKFGKYILLEKK